MTDVDPRPEAPRRSRMPGTFFYERGLPILLIVLGAVAVAMVVFALGILLGIIPFT